MNENRTKKNQLREYNIYLYTSIKILGCCINDIISSSDPHIAILALGPEVDIGTNEIVPSLIFPKHFKSLQAFTIESKSRVLTKPVNEPVIVESFIGAFAGKHRKIFKIVKIPTTT